MLYAIVAVLILILDQGLKYYVTLHLPLNAGAKTLVPGLLQLRHIHNTGSAFSFLNDWPFATWLFLGVTVIFAVLVILALRRRWIKGGFGRWMALFVLAGALGNGIDRLLNGYVVDMLEFAFKLPLIGSFPVFNVADIFITCGAIAFCLYILLHKEQAEETKAYGNVRRGPGGSVTTRPAPKPREEIEPEPAPVREAGPDAPTRRETGRREAGRHAAPRPAAETTHRSNGGDPFAEWVGTAEIGTDAAPAQKPAREVVPEAPSAGKAFTLDIPESRGRESAPAAASGPAELDIRRSEAAKHENPFAAASGPVELNIPAPAGGRREKPAAANGPVELNIPAPAGGRREKPAAASGPVELNIPAPAGGRREKPAAASAPVELNVPAPQPAKPAPQPEQIRIEAADEDEFSLESILNEFRDH